MPASQKPAFTKRLYAVLIDYGIILGYMALLASIALGIYRLTGRLPNWLDYGVATAEIMGFFVLVLPVGLYLYRLETSAHRATIGKRVLHLTVISTGRKSMPSKRQIALRTIIKLLPWEVAHFFMWHAVATARDGQNSFPLWLEIGLLGCLALPITYVVMVAFQSQGRGPHDLAAGTRVVTAAR